MRVLEQRRGIKNIIQQNPVSFLFIIIITVFFISSPTLVELSFDDIDNVFFNVVNGQIRNPEFKALYERGALNGIWVAETGEYWRYLTVMLLHGGFFHYLFNVLFGIFILGAALERLIGSFRYFFLFLLSGVLASGAVVLSDILTSSPIPTVGASGAIFGVLGAFLFLTTKRPDMFDPQDIAGIRGLIFINVIYTFIGGNISIPGHIGGLIAGYLIAALLGLHRGGPAHRRRGFQDPYSGDNFIEPGSIDDLEEVDILDDYEEDDEDPFSKYDNRY